MQALKTHCYRRRVEKYLGQVKRYQLVQKYFTRYRETFIERQTVKLRDHQIQFHYRQRLMEGALRMLRYYAYYKYEKRAKEERAAAFAVNYKAVKTLRVLQFYTQYKVQKKQTELEVFNLHRRKKLQKSLVKVIQVGLYWAKVKGRFRTGASSSGAERRIYLAIKYGNLWRTKVLIAKIRRASSESKSLAIPASQTDPQRVLEKLMRGSNTLRQSQASLADLNASYLLSESAQHSEVNHSQP